MPLHHKYRGFAALVLIVLWASAVGLAADLKESTSAAITKAVKIVDRQSRKPLAQLTVEITSEVVAPCLAPPCPVLDKQHWQGTTDNDGVLRFPATLDKPSAVVYLHAIGSEFAADIHGEGGRNGLPIVRLEPSDKRPSDKRPPDKK